MSKETEAGCGAVAAPVERPVRLDPERLAFEDWADERWGREAYRHKSDTSGEWAAWQAAREHSEGRIYTQADLLEAVKTERHACSICVWMVLQDALEPGADDKGLEGWMREAEARVKGRLGLGA